MPELPDVEVFRRFAENHTLNQQIKKAGSNRTSSHSAKFTRFFHHTQEERG